MFTIKQYLSVLLIGASVFFITFGFVFTHFRDAGLQDALVQTEELKTSEAAIEPIMIEDEIRILPTTKVVVQLVDEHYNTIIEKEMDGFSLVDLTEEELLQRFTDYEVSQFDEREVVLEKKFEEPTLPTVYSIVVEDGIIGIREQGEKIYFTSLDLSEKDFIQQELALFEEEGLPITFKQKEELEKEPYYIEKILQNYGE